jgi:hypothetical protein
MNPKEQLIEILEDMIIASSSNKDVEFNMLTFVDETYCGTSCCLCGDYALYKNPTLIENIDIWETSVQGFTDILLDLSIDLFDSEPIIESIYGGTAVDRKFFLMAGLEHPPENLLNHPHLNEWHSDRSIGIDYIKQFIEFVKAY